jgi:hypothetical protein
VVPRMIILFPFPRWLSGRISHWSIPCEVRAGKQAPFLRCTSSTLSLSLSRSLANQQNDEHERREQAKKDFSLASTSYIIQQTPSKSMEVIVTNANRRKDDSVYPSNGFEHFVGVRLVICTARRDVQLLSSNVDRRAISSFGGEFM